MGHYETDSPYTLRDVQPSFITDGSDLADKHNYNGDYKILAVFFHIHSHFIIPLRIKNISLQKRLSETVTSLGVGLLYREPNPSSEGFFLF